MTTPDLDDLPGHLIRRLQQTAVAAFLQETQGLGITPVQYAALHRVGLQAGIDQRRLARAIGYDTSTIGDVVERLEARGWLQREVSKEDRRVRLLSLTDDGRAQLDAATPGMLRAQDRMLEPLTDAERTAFRSLLRKLAQPRDDIPDVAPATAEPPGASRRPRARPARGGRSTPLTP